MKTKEDLILLFGYIAISVIGLSVALSMLGAKAEQQAQNERVYRVEIIK